MSTRRPIKVAIVGGGYAGFAAAVTLARGGARVTARSCGDEEVVDAARDPHVRATDQIIVFLNDTAYDRVDAQSGKVERRTRKAGEILWHDKGEHAPKLINRGSKPMRSLVIALK